MKKFLNILLFIPLFVLPAASYGQEYLQIVSLESDNGTQGVFTSAGMGEKKKDVEVNAIKSLFYTLFFQGVEGVADGKPLVAKPNVPYTNSFFNDMARYSSYVTGTEEIVKSKKTGNYFQGTFKITLRLRQLINDVRKNTHYDEMMAEQPEIKLPNPTIIVVPYKKEGESYQAILEDAHFLLDELGGNTWIKIPVTEDGLAAISTLSREGVHVTAASVFTFSQGMLAYKAGAECVSVYCNRAQDNGIDYTSVISSIKNAFPEKMLLAASFKNTAQAEIASYSGADSLTLKAKVLFSDLKTDLMKKTVDSFKMSWLDAYKKDRIKPE